MLGIERCVIVHTAAHGFDLSVTADAIAAKGGSYLGVGLVPLTISDAELKRLDAPRLPRRALSLHAAPGAERDDRRGGRLRQAAGRYRLAFADPHGGRADRRADAGAEALGRAGDDRPHGPGRCVARARPGAVQQPAQAAGRPQCMGEGERLRPRHPARARLMPTRCRSRASWWRKPATAASGGSTGRIPITPGRCPTTACWSTSWREIAPSEAQRQALLVDNPQRFYRFAAAKKEERDNERAFAGQGRHRHRRRLRRPRLGQWARDRRALRPGRRQDFRGRPRSRQRRRDRRSTCRRPAARSSCINAT